MMKNNFNLGQEINCGARHSIITLLKEYVRLVRPSQWIKNLFILVGILFSQKWHDSGIVAQAGAAFLSFAILSSAVYIMNDLLDLEKDRLHPRKKFRPLAKGTISPSAAVITQIILMSFAFTLSTLLVSDMATFLMLLYFLQNVLYSIWLKHMVILDVFIIASGFMLRILVGTLGIGIAPSGWLIICGIMVTLLIGFGTNVALN